MAKLVLTLLCLFYIVAQIFALPPDIPNVIEKLPAANIPVAGKELTLIDVNGGNNPEAKVPDTAEPQRKGLPDKLFGLAVALAKIAGTLGLVVALFALVDQGARFTKEWVPNLVNYWKEKMKSPGTGNEAGLVGTTFP